MNSTAIEAKQLPLHDILRDNFAFIIPSYQRPYAWEEEHTQELYDDLYSFFEDAPDGESIYFLGCIVVIHGAGKEAEVVDGQQRLTTLTMLLAALRTRLPDTEKNDITAYLYEKGNKFAGTPNRYRLCLRERDRAFFQEYIQDSDGTARLLALEPAQLANDAQQRLYTNMRYFLDRVQQLTPTQASNFATCLIQRCYVVLVATLERDSAYRIFSVLNDRGLDLSPVDILKAEIIGAIPQDERAAYTQKWEDIETNLGRDGFGVLFAHIRTLATRTRPRETLLREFRTMVLLDSQGQPRDARLVIDAVIAPYAQAYDIIHNCNYQSTQDAGAINALLGWLNQIDNADWTPPAMSFLNKHMGDPVAVLAFVRQLERLAASMMIRHVGPAKRSERYRPLLLALTRNDESAIATLLELTPDERRATIAYLDTEIYRSHAARYVLLRLDDLLSDGAARYSHPILTIEHVLPQKIVPGSEWEQLFPDPDWNATNLHRLGNLILLTRRKNVMAYNYDFTTKKTKYFTGRGGVSTCALTTQVLHEAAWTPEVLLCRQQDLVRRLVDLWRLA